MLPLNTARLTRREAEVLHLVAWGYANKEIAKRLGLSVKTVESHKANGMRKMELLTRAELVRGAVESGWLTPEAVPDAGRPDPPNGP